MPRSPIVLALLMCVAFPASALAQGLYEPFPEPGTGAQAARYVKRLGVTATPAELERGRFVAARDVSGLTAPRVQAASDRAGAGSGKGVALLAGLCGALLAGGLLTVRARL
jgi:hypothetical protein